jgi:hypothetical protein
VNTAERAGAVTPNGCGRRLFEHLGDAQSQLQPLRVIDAPGVTHLKYRVTSQLPISDRGA